jgi:hypothetical protein
MPRYDVIEHHQSFVRAPSDRVYRHIRELDLAKSYPVLLLLALRGIPRLLTGKLPARRRLTLGELTDFGFVVLDEKVGAEIVLGVIGRFWRLNSGVRRISAAEFAAFAEPGFAKAAWNFWVEPHEGGGSLVVTETRVACTDRAARSRFLIYWRLVGPFSALIRRLILRQIKREAEKAIDFS